ncbi:hypothetical protein N7474_004090 [Penicillium riverlandense]|uniref:uncharacterized protein n=1 Tax=Penicillium riverlandense TaxID=1903569 RepID=UPI002547B151|nr:uncharacterized protein N7474_004090 [Penicillium riverlandense]KAJ5818499.1 hypothetical protein N7474_004090 [Penicillium riverlandense]
MGVVEFVDRHLRLYSWQLRAKRSRGKLSGWSSAASLRSAALLVMEYTGLAVETYFNTASTTSWGLWECTEATSGSIVASSWKTLTQKL